jgi:arylsulfatase
VTPMSKPNILFIMTDQQRWDALGCSGGWVRTPWMDRIASEGVRFSNCVTNSPVCIPARVSLATGLYPHNTGIWDNIHYDMPESTPTWMQAVRAAGYRTSLFGKTHLHHHGGDLREREHLLHAYGLDDVDEIGGPRASTSVGSHMTARWERVGLWQRYREDYRERFTTKPHMVRPSALPFDEYADVYVGQQAKQYLKGYTRPEPWCCWVSFGGPHEPWDTPEPYASLYRPADMPPPAVRPRETGPRPQGALDRKLEHAKPLTPDEIGALRANYAGNVSLIDAQIGEILQTIEARGELSNTVIAFSSDHGEMNGDAGLIYKNNFLNGAVRVPMLLRTPESMKSPLAGTVSDSPVEWFDLGPTLVELAGGQLMHQQFAKSLQPALAGGAEHRPFAISELDGEIMYMDRQWKMVLNAQGLTYLLFDRERDPGETTNLAGDRSAAGTRTELRLRILEHLVRTQAQLPRKKKGA